jgi:hypothetical protein
MEESCIKASDVLNCISVGISTAVNDHIPYKDTPILIETGSFGNGKTAEGLPSIPYAGIAMAGISWGISGNMARTRAQEVSVEIMIETERMADVLVALIAVEKRVDEGEDLLFALSKKLKKSLDRLQSLTVDNTNISEEAVKEIDTSINLIKSLKQVIETDICDSNSFLVRKSGVVFRKIEQEVLNV